MRIAPGSRIGPYDVVACIGVGGMGEVYRAHDARLGRDVALKVLPDVFARDPDRLTRFEREARTLASLNHPNIAQIHGLEEALPVAAGPAGARALVLEFVEGPTLAERIAHGALPLDEALQIARQIALGLEAAHELGIVHRDLKPANIKVRVDGSVKLLDFGLARAIDASSGHPGSDTADSPTITSPAMTHAGVILGTAAYMAPEQARGRAVDQRADVWAFGCVLYEMLSGRRAFLGDDVSSTLAAVLKDAPDTSVLPAGLPAAVERLLRRCLVKDPKNRLSAIGDARLELDEPQEYATAAPAPGRKPWPVVAMLACVALGAAVSALVAWTMWRSTTSDTRARTRVSLLAPENILLFHDTAGAAVSPDGRWVAFVTIGQSGTELWVRDVAVLTPRRLEGTEGASLPFWSPDSARIAFFAGGKLKTVAVDGGRVDAICDAQDARGGTWNGHGTIVFAAAASGQPLMKVSINRGAPSPATTLDAARNEAGHRFPFFLPDGDHFLFVALPAKDSKYDVSAGSLTTGSRESIGSFESAPVFVEPGYLLFTRRNALVAQRFDPGSRRLAGEPIPLDDAPDGVAGEYDGGPAVSASPRALVYLTYPMEKTRIFWMDTAGKESPSLDIPPGFYGNISISPDQRTAAVTRLDTLTDWTIWLLDLRAGGTMRPFVQARGKNYAPAWAHDSKRLFFSSNREGAEQIYVKAVDSSEPERILFRTPDAFKQALSASPDGKWLVFQHLTSTALTNVSRVDLSAGTLSPEALLQGPSAESGAKISPDGRWIAYASDEAGSIAVYVARFPDLGQKTLVAKGGRQGIFWGSDSRQLIYIGDGPSLVDLNLGAEVRVVSRRQLLFGRPQIVAGDVTSDLRRSLVSVPEKGMARRSLTLLTDWVAAIGRK